VVVALSLTALTGLAAVALEGGLMFYARRRIQAEADAAALAAATDLFTNWYTNSGADPTGSAGASAVTTTAAQGYPDRPYTTTFTYTNGQAVTVGTGAGFPGGGDSKITINIPPLSGPFTGLNGYAEVIIQFDQPRYFSGIWGSSVIPISARAVARGQYVPGNAGIVVLNTTVKGALEVDGNLNIANNGSIWDNSNGTVNEEVGPGAAYIASTGVLHAGNLYVVGTGTAGLTNLGSTTATVTTGVSPITDPLVNLPQPSPATPGGTGDYGSYPPSGTTWTAGNTYTIQPGTYKSLTIPAGVTINMAPGVYVFSSNSTGSSSSGTGSGSTSGSASAGAGGTVGITFTAPSMGQSAGSLTGSGVMIYDANEGDHFFNNVTGNVNLSAPTSGVYQGISFYQWRATGTNPTITEVHFEDTLNMTMTGTIYMPTGEIDFRPDGSTTTFNMGNYISNQMEAGQGYNASMNKSNGIINLTPSNGAPTVRQLQLVE
jgi:hypothetical protein